MPGTHERLKIDHVDPVGMHLSPDMLARAMIDGFVRISSGRQGRIRRGIVGVHGRSVLGSSLDEADEGSCVDSRDRFRRHLADRTVALLQLLRLVLVALTPLRAVRRDWIAQIRS